MSEPIHNAICNQWLLKKWPAESPVSSFNLGTSVAWNTKGQEHSSEPKQCECPRGGFLRSEFPEILPALFSYLISSVTCRGSGHQKQVISSLAPEVIFFPDTQSLYELTQHCCVKNSSLIKCCFKIQVITTVCVYMPMFVRVCWHLLCGGWNDNSPKTMRRLVVTSLNFRVRP